MSRFSGIWTWKARKRPHISTASVNNHEPSNCDAVSEFASLAPISAETIVQQAAMMMLSLSSCISAMFFLQNHVIKARDGEIYSRSKIIQQSYSKSYNKSYSNDSTWTDCCTAIIQLANSNQSRWSSTITVVLPYNCDDGLHSRATDRCLAGKDVMKVGKS